MMMVWRDSLLLRSFRFGLMGLVAITSSAPLAVAQQSEVGPVDLRGQVVTAENGDPLPTTLVSIVDTNQRALADRNGRFILANLAPNVYQIRIEQLGFMTKDTVVDLRSVVTPLVVRLAREPIDLPAVVVRPEGRTCKARTAPDLKDQIAVAAIAREAHKNGVRFRALVDNYPFELQYERVRRYLKKNGEVVGAKTDTIQRRSIDLQWSYEPGNVLVRSITESGDTSYILPTPSAYVLSDSQFQESHCFEYTGVTQVSGAPSYRVDFGPLPEIDGPEVAGQLYLDSASYVLKKAIYRFENLPKGLHFSDVNVEVEYQEVAPGLVIPRTLRVSQKLEQVRFRGTSVHEYTEEYRLLDYTFVGLAPGADSPAFRRDPSSPQHGGTT